MHSADQLHRLEGFAGVSAHFQTEARQLAAHQAVDLARQDIVVERCWLNVLGRGHSMGLHKHPNSLYTGLYFLNAPKDGALLFLYNPAKEMGFSMPVKKDNPLNEDAHVIRPKTGELLIFPSALAQSFQVHDAETEHLHLGFTVSARLK
ncbi:MAG: hypothetical protein HOB37_05965 [Rhodospirillaceae bacterium]|nr:hypothetical protein [Rhodospirillaceae bacterium]MBT5513767.1 hypothetical protein [Rhodospirillaceae bacterium]MBT6087713.1 hypothetical protein [Rhodospirillaceae bacterium]MBT6607992.1 hypothetical protein [Rhodospirillaceae bacterium]MBT6884311.1 hypothetical protein [Rhodospirillaceae bacterium]